MPFNNYAPQYVFKGQVQSDTAPSSDNDLVRKQDVSGLSFISSIASGSSSYLNVSNGELSVTSLLISDVHVDNSQTSLANFISNEGATAASLKKGDFLVLTAATGGSETFIVSGFNGASAGNYTEVESGLTSAEIVAKLSAGAGINISAGGQISSSITQYTDSNARAALSAGAGISYNQSTGQISSSITQYTDANARAAISATGNINYDSSTGQISTSLTQYADSNARAALSAGAGISYNQSTGQISSTITQYTDTNARAAISAPTGSGLSYNSSNGQISVDNGFFRATFTNQSFDANTAKTFNHDLGEKLVHVSVYDSNDDLVHAAVSLTDSDNLTITCSDALTGVSVVISI